MCVCSSGNKYGQHALYVTSCAVRCEVSEVKSLLNQNIASSHVYSGCRMAVCPLKNTHWAKWNLHTVENKKKAPSQLACIKIPHRPSSFFRDLFLLFLFLIESIFFLALFWRGITEDLQGKVVLTSSVPFLTWLNLLFCLLHSCLEPVSCVSVNLMFSLQ